MPVFRLPHDLPVFPDPDEAEPEGLLAVGGDLGLPRLLTAYANGIFPWFNHGDPILWWSPDPRCILEPERLHVPKSLRRVLNSQRFRITVDQAFAEVMRGCAEAERPTGRGTWILPDMVRAYTEMHRAGFAHSVEAWEGKELAGGIYGVSLGGVFFGESMFYRRPNASKVALVTLMRLLERWGFDFMDCQQTTRHALRFGAREVPRREFLQRLHQALDFNTAAHLWREAAEEVTLPCA
jgi:leucyl/phenylalanyl-tRNA--protein transferase